MRSRFIAGLALLIVAFALLAATPTASSPGGQQPDLDSRLAAITKAGDNGRMDPARIPDLQQFIRQYPNYQHLDRAYQSLLSCMSIDLNTPAEALSRLADDVLAKFPKDGSLRAQATRAKLRALSRLGNPAATAAFVQRVAETETDPSTLEAAAHMQPTADRVALLERAIAERQKNRDVTGFPLLDDLSWSYAESLEAAGRKADALQVRVETVERMKKTIATVGALPEGNPGRGRLTLMQMNLASRYEALAKAALEAGNGERALEYVNEAARAGNDVAQTEELRAGIYEKAGKADLALDSYARLYASRMEPQTRDRIRDITARNGRSADEAFARARQIRSANATPFEPFDLKLLGGGRIALGSLQARAVLVNFFFPT